MNSNFKLAYDHLISKLKTVGSIHRINGEIEENKAAKEYQEELLNFFNTKEIRFDFALLGMGKDGHVASLFPKSEEIKKRNDLVLVTNKTYNGFKRITMGLDLINRINYKLLLVIGKDKFKTLVSKDDSLPINKINNKEVVYLE